MPFVLTEVVLQRLIEYGIQQLRQNPAAFNDIFAQYNCQEMASEYGQKYIDQIREWFFGYKVPVVQAWTLNVQYMPSISIHLSTESEDEAKAALNDFAGDFNGLTETGTAAFTVMVDIGIHGTKTGDQVLWLYYIVSYILFKHKLMAHRLGLKLHTYSASDYNRDQRKLADNVYSRWIRFKCTTQNFWDADPYLDIEELNTLPVVGLPPASQVSVTPDVDIEEVDTTANGGIIASRVGDEDGDEDLAL